MARRETSSKNGSCLSGDEKEGSLLYSVPRQEALEEDPGWRLVILGHRRGKMSSLIQGVQGQSGIPKTLSAKNNNKN